MQNSTQDCGFRAHTVDAAKQKYLDTHFFAYSKRLVPTKALMLTLIWQFISSPQLAT